MEICRCAANKVNTLIVPSELGGALLRSVTVAPDAGLVSVVPEVIFLFHICCLTV